MIQLGTSLDFDRKFCEAAIDDLLNNKNISDEPIIFADNGTAESFLRDAVRVASVDGAIHQKELDWLKTVAEANGIDEKLLNDKIHADN